MKNWKKIIERLDYWRAMDKKIQKATDDYISIIAEGSYSPFIENSCASSFIDGVSDGNEEIKDLLEYYVYEVSSWKNTFDCSYEVTSTTGTKYEFTKRDDVIRFFEENYP